MSEGVMIENPITELEAVNKAELLATEANITQVARLVMESEKYIKDRGFNVILVTGKSGVVVEKLLDIPDGTKILWWEDPNRKYTESSSMNLKLILEELDINKSGSRLVVVDEHMSTGYRKAHEFLLGLSKAGLKDFGFVSFIGPSSYQTDRRTKVEEIDWVLDGDTHLKDHLFFPETKNFEAWKLLRSLEELADHYHDSEAVRSFIEETTGKIIETKTKLRSE